MSLNETSKLAQIKEECRTMAKTLKKLQEQEINLKCQNKILAREAINLGYHDSFSSASTTAGGSSTAATTDADAATSGDTKKSSKKKKSLTSTKRN